MDGTPLRVIFLIMIKGEGKSKGKKRVGYQVIRKSGDQEI